MQIIIWYLLMCVCAQFNLHYLCCYIAIAEKYRFNRIAIVIFIVINIIFSQLFSLSVYLY